MAMEKLRVLPLPLGFGFRPTEEEIFSNYLTRKVNGEKIDFDFIPEFDVSQHEPSEISSIFPGPKSDTLWHFFPTSEKKAYKGNRSTKAGYWKFVKESRCWQGDKHEGVRRTFTFYIGRRVGNNLGKCTAWIMHEYFMQDKDHIVLCRVTKRDKEYLTDADTSAPAEEGSTPVPNPEQKNFSSSKGTEVEDSCSFTDDIVTQQRSAGTSYENPNDTNVPTIDIYNLKSDVLARLYDNDVKSLENTDFATKDGAVGFDFRPTETELISHLKRKVLGEKLRFGYIPEFDIYKHEPWDLPSTFSGLENATEWYFFAPADIKYITRPGAVLATKAGYWKTNYRGHTIMEKSKNIGDTEPRIFYKGQTPDGTKTVWFMQEYFLDENECKDAREGSDKKDLFVLCRVTKKGADTLAPATGDSNNTNKQEDIEMVPELFDHSFGPTALVVGLGTYRAVPVESTPSTSEPKINSTPSPVEGSENDNSFVSDDIQSILGTRDHENTQNLQFLNDTKRVRKY